LLTEERLNKNSTKRLKLREKKLKPLPQQEQLKKRDWQMLRKRWRQLPSRKPKKKKERNKKESKPRKSQQREEKKKKLLLTLKELMVKLNLMKSFLRQQQKKVRSIDSMVFWKNFVIKRNLPIRLRQMPKLPLKPPLKKKRRNRLSLKLLERRL
jgi:hypothetical protein